MSRLIDADALIPKLRFIQEAEHQIYGKGSWGFALKCIREVQDAPTIEERKTGEWIREPGHIPKCSRCGIYSDDADRGYDKFCPNCGYYNGGEN